MTNNQLTFFKKNLKLFGLEDKLDFIIKLFQLDKLPRVLMLSGKKGIGKSTLVYHFINYIFDKENYDLKEKKIRGKTNFYNQFSSLTHPNIIYLSGTNFKDVKVDDIRNLKSRLQKTILSNDKRFVILDDVELFNESSVNALLKIIEEPPKNNFFFLINNKSKSLIDTIFESLIKENNLKSNIDYKLFNISPGFFLFLENFLSENNIDITGNFLENLEKTLILYKKQKDINLINVILFLSDYYFYQVQKNKINSFEQIIEKKNFVVKNLNKFFIYKLNQNSLISIIKEKIIHG